KTGITPQLATFDRLREAEKELLHPVGRLHAQWSGTPKRYAAVTMLPRPSACFRQSASPPRSACQSSPCTRAHRDGSTALLHDWSAPPLPPAQTSTAPRAASGCLGTSPRLTPTVCVAGSPVFWFSPTVPCVMIRLSMVLSVASHR